VACIRRAALGGEHESKNEGCGTPGSRVDLSSRHLLSRCSSLCSLLFTSMFLSIFAYLCAHRHRICFPLLYWVFFHSFTMRERSHCFFDPFSVCVRQPFKICCSKSTHWCSHASYRLEDRAVCDSGLLLSGRLIQCRFSRRRLFVRVAFYQHCNRRYHGGHRSEGHQRADEYGEPVQFCF
jgi:hypothetical protein